MTTGDSPEAALDAVLRAIADPTRRRVLRLLAQQPGMTTSEIAARVPGMTRWGVMKHIAVLGDAGLVQTLPEGRRRRHFRESGALASLRAWLDESSA